MSARVYKLAFQRAGDGLSPPDPGAGLADLVRRVGAPPGAPRGAAWGLKIRLAPPGFAPGVQPSWLAALAASLGAGPESFAWDSLSITTRGLDTPAGLLAQAERQGYAAPGSALAFRIPEAAGPGQSSPAGETTQPPVLDLAPAAALATLTAIRPHPHLGFWGAVGDLGLGTASREAKLDLHRDIRPRVDTPLCAGCGACLNVCLFDAIVIKAGRAVIDHVRCTGCGECMSVCFMAGIAPEAAAGIGRFQAGVAAAAAAAAGSFAGRTFHAAFLVDMDRHTSGAGKRTRPLLGDLGILASRDPVALDQAVWDEITRACGGPLKTWSGYAQDPGVLLDEAAAAGLGSRDYLLAPVS
ncbi:MAG: DUF362 domain-containing protein [Candidatus Krumholzibacteriia bacterium]